MPRSLLVGLPLLLTACVLHPRRVLHLMDAGRLGEATAGAAVLGEDDLTARITAVHLRHAPAISMSLVPADHLRVNDPTYGTEWVLAELRAFGDAAIAEDLDLWVVVHEASASWVPCPPETCDHAWVARREGTPPEGAGGIYEALGAIGGLLAMPFDVRQDLPIWTDRMEARPELPPPAPTLRTFGASAVLAAPPDAIPLWMAPPCSGLGLCARRFVLVAGAPEPSAEPGLDLRVTWRHDLAAVEAEWHLPASPTAHGLTAITSAWSRGPHALPPPSRTRLVRP